MPRCAVCGQDNPGGFRFCGACGAPLTAPAQAAVATHRAALRDLLRELATAAGASSPGEAALQLHMLIDGATAVAVVDRQPGAAASARTMAAGVLAGRPGRARALAGR